MEFIGTNQRRPTLKNKDCDSCCRGFEPHQPPHQPPHSILVGAGLVDCFVVTDIDRRTGRTGHNVHRPWRRSVRGLHHRAAPAPRSVAKLLEVKYPKERLIQEVARLQAKCKIDRLCSISMPQIRLKSLEYSLKRSANGRPACGTRCIFTTRALASCRRRSLSSNVSLVSRNSQHC